MWYLRTLVIKACLSSCFSSSGRSLRQLFCLTGFSWCNEWGTRVPVNKLIWKLKLLNTGSSAPHYDQLTSADQSHNHWDTLIFCEQSQCPPKWNPSLKKILGERLKKNDDKLCSIRVLFQWFTDFKNDFIEYQWISIEGTLMRKSLFWDSYCNNWSKQDSWMGVKIGNVWWRQGYLVSNVFLSHLCNEST